LVSRRPRWRPKLAEGKLLQMCVSYSKQSNVTKPERKVRSRLLIPRRR
jgi:hypothetical protein